jgi:hypothetical protein
MFVSTQWYYVQGSERVGPVERSEIDSLFHAGTITAESFIWKKGFDNWKSLDSVDELSDLLEGGPDSIPAPDDISEIPSMSEEVPTTSEAVGALDLHSVSEDAKVFTVKVGYDRGGSETEYGPFSLNQIKKAYEEKRISEKTFIFTPGMSTWVLLGDFELFEKISGVPAEEVSDDDRRISVRKPFIARLFFHDNNNVYEGICRDISVGGLQILVSDFPCQVDDKVSLNVHPDNSDYHFTASGRVVRKLEGDSGFSMRFEDLSSEAVTSIQAYVDNN